MGRKIRALIARPVLFLSLAAIVAVTEAAEALAKPAPHAAQIHMLPGGTLPIGWVFPVFVAALAVATLLTAIYATKLRVAVAARRRRLGAVRTSGGARVSVASGTVARQVGRLSVA